LTKAGTTLSEKSPGKATISIYADTRRNSAAARDPPSCAAIAQDDPDPARKTAQELRAEDHAILFINDLMRLHDGTAPAT
jgi:hypothetical protein